MSSLVKRDLFGGAITAETSPTLIDASYVINDMYFFKSLIVMTIGKRFASSPRHARSVHVSKLKCQHYRRDLAAC